MHLGGAGLTQHPDERALGVAAHDRVVDDDEPFAADHLAQRIELQADTELADRLRRLDEGTTDVSVLHQSLAVRNPGFLGESDGRRHARLRYRDDQVTVGGVFLGESATDLDAGRVHRAAVDDRVGTGEIDVFEDAPAGGRLGEARAAHAVGVDGQQLARLDVADERRTHDVEGGGLRGDDPAAVEAAE